MILDSDPDSTALCPICSHPLRSGSAKHTIPAIIGGPSHTLAFQPALKLAVVVHWTCYQSYYHDDPIRIRIDPNAIHHLE